MPAKSRKNLNYYVVETFSKKPMRPEGNCYYCGTFLSVEASCWDHFIPLSKGGETDRDNLVLACGGCNAVKGSQLFEAARLGLLLKRIGWPKFKPDQLTWLKARGFDLSEFESAKLHFEETQK